MMVSVNDNGFTYYIDASGAKRSVRQSVLADTECCEDTLSRIAGELWSVLLQNFERN